MLCFSHASLGAYIVFARVEIVTRFADIPMCVCVSVHSKTGMSVFTKSMPVTLPLLE
jgi:hypothetical protein